jgi:MFS family permease
VAVPVVLRNRNFALFFGGVVLSEMGVRATLAANLYQVYDLTGSTVQVGLIGLTQAFALLVLSPLGGVYADRLDRRRLLQVTQITALLVVLGLGVVTLSGMVQTGHILLASLLITVTATFDRPARQALVPTLVPAGRLPQAFALLGPARELAILVGPTLAGLLIAVGGSGLVYLFNSGTYAVLVVLLAVMRITATERPERRSLRTAVWEGISFVRRRRIIWQLMSLDLVLTLFGAYRVLLPAFAMDVLDVGPTGYGLLASAPAAGALMGTWLIFRLVQSPRSGVLLLVATMSYGLCCVFFAQSRWFYVTAAFALGLGFFDALASTIRLSTVQLATPDPLRGRVSSLYTMTARGGPALGDANIGWVASLVGPAVALALGGLAPLLYAGALLAFGRTIRQYSTPGDEPPAGPAPPGPGPVSPPDAEPTSGGDVAALEPGRPHPG